MLGNNLCPPRAQSTQPLFWLAVLFYCGGQSKGGQRVGPDQAEGVEMIRFSVDKSDRILVVELSGIVSEGDIDGAIEELQLQYPGVGVHLRGGDAGGFKMLADWQNLEGWEKGARTLGTITLKTIGDAVRKVAVVADAEFKDEEARFADVAPTAVVRFFPSGQREAAQAWLRGD